MLLTIAIDLSVPRLTLSTAEMVQNSSNGHQYNGDVSILGMGVTSSNHHLVKPSTCRIIN